MKVVQQYPGVCVYAHELYGVFEIMALFLGTGDHGHSLCEQLVCWGYWGCLWDGVDMRAAVGVWSWRGAIFSRQNTTGGIPCQQARC